MPTNSKKHRPLLIVSAFLLVSLTAGCGGDDPAKGSSGDDFEQALAYSQCLRDNGVPNQEDPQRNSDGSSSLKKKINKGEEAAMAKAEEACRDEDPANNKEDTEGTVDSAKLAEWTKCMRGRLPKFPDPEVAGGLITVDLRNTGVSQSTYEDAREACGDDEGGNVRTFNGDGPAPEASGK